VAHKEAFYNARESRRCEESRRMRRGGEGRGSAAAAAMVAGGRAAHYLISNHFLSTWGRLS